METPESIRQQYASPPRGESAEQRRRRLANRRAAKYRHFRALESAQDTRGVAAQQQRAQNTRRQRSRRERLDDEARQRVREQNRRRQQVRRQALSEPAREKIREKQRHRQRERRQLLDPDARDELRERERLRIRRRRRKQRQEQQDEHTDGQTDDQESACGAPQRPPDKVAPLGRVVLRPAPSVSQRAREMTPPTLPHLRVPGASVSAPTPELPTLRQHQEQQRRQARHVPFGGSDGQLTLPMPPPPVSALERPHAAFRDRMPSLPHLQQVAARPQSSALLHAVPPPLFPMPSASGTAAGGAIGTSTATPASPALASAVDIARTHVARPQTVAIMPPASLAPASTPLGGVLPLVSHRQQQSQQPQQQTQPQQPRAPIVLPPAHRSLPPLPDFLNSREAFDPASTASTAAASASSASVRTGPRRALFPSISELSASHSDPKEPDGFYRQ